jgi:hypothetical protein
MAEFSDILYDASNDTYYTREPEFYYTLVDGDNQLRIPFKHIDVYQDATIIEKPVLLTRIFHPCYAHGFEDTMALFNFKYHHLKSASCDIVLSFTNQAKHYLPPGWEHPENNIDKLSWTYKTPAYNEFINFLSSEPPIWECKREPKLYLYRRLFIVDKHLAYTPNNCPSSRPGNSRNLQVFSNEKMQGWMFLFRDEIGRFYNIPPATHSKNIFIHRSSNRQLRDSSIQQMLQKIPDLEVICLEKMSFRDQILKIKDARLIVSTHGAGLFNTLFCKEGTIVIEIFPGQDVRQVIFPYFCALLGHRFTTYTEPSPSGRQHVYGEQFFDVNIDTVISYVLAQLR